MPQIAVYIPEKLYLQLIQAGESKSKTVQEALKLYFDSGGGTNE